MLAKIVDHVERAALTTPAAERTYSGFPWWHALLVEPNREQRSAEWLKRVNVFVYLPTYTRKVRRRGCLHHAKLYAVIPGMLFAPEEILAIPQRKQIFDFARVRDFIRTAGGHFCKISKADIELVRLMEAKLNLPPEAQGVFFKVGQQVRFKDGSLWEGWGICTIIEIVDEARIVVEVPGLFGRATQVTIAASEIEEL